MKVKSEDILKPGAKLVVERIDWDSPLVKKALKQSEKEHRELMRIKRQRYPPF